MLAPVFKGLPCLVELLLGGGAGSQQPFLPLELALLIVRSGLGGSDISPFLVVGRLQRVNLEAHSGELRFGLIYRDLEWARVKPKEHLTRGNVLIVLDVDFDDSAGNVGADGNPRGLT